MKSKGITKLLALLLIMLAVGLTFTPAEAGVSVGGAINPIPTPTNIFTAPGQETDVIIRVQNTSQTTPPDLFQFLPATLTGVTLTIMACADSACTVPLPGTLEFVPVGGNGCVSNDLGVTSCALDLGTDATGNTVAITISGGGVALPSAIVGPLDLATIRVRSTAPVSTPGGEFYLRAETGPDDVSATFNSQTASGGMQGSTILIFQAAPCIDVTKDCTDPTGQCDLEIPYAGVVTNCGNETLANVTVTDAPSGQVFNIGTLAPGESAPYSSSYTGVLGENTDIVTATGTGQISGQTVTDTATDTCTVTCVPCIDVTKDCDNSICADIPFSGTVTNCGPDTLNNVTVTDSPSGQVFNIGTLAPGASAPFSGNYAATPNVPSTDTVTATGVGAVSQETVTDTASATCTNQCNSCVSITKDCVNPAACVTSIPFSGTVTNCGQDTLNNVVVTDAPSGQTFNLGSLAPGASAPFSSSYTGTLGSNTDVATVNAVGAVSGQAVTDSDDATCTVSCTSCIDVTKQCTDAVDCNSDIPFSGTVTNCGQDTLNNVTVVDDKAGTVLGPTTLAPGASAQFSGTYTGTLGQATTNVVTASGTGAVSGQAVSDTASATCNTPDCPCKVEITKTVALDDNCDGAADGPFGENVTQDAGECVVYKICVTNTGEQALNGTGVTVSDAHIGLVPLDRRPPML
jgi:uncharacterized repeat protein (TIGR01451 family)